LAGNRPEFEIVKQIRMSLKMGSRADPVARLVIDRDQIIGGENR
jgi:hypothetical protein